MTMSIIANAERATDQATQYRYGNQVKRMNEAANPNLQRYQQSKSGKPARTTMKPPAQPQNNMEDVFIRVSLWTYGSKSNTHPVQVGLSKDISNELIS